MSSSSSSVPITAAGGPGSIAPTPQNTPLTTAPLSSALSKPTVPTIGEGDEEEDPSGPPDTPPGAGAGAGGALAGLGPKGHSAILGLVQQRLQGLMGQSSGYIEGLPSGTKKRVLALKGVQSDYETLTFQYKKECLELERKYTGLAQPLFNRRLEIISGKSLPTPGELEKGHTQEVKDKEEFSDDEDDEADEDAADGAEKEQSSSFLPSDPIVDGEPGAGDGVPQFWLTTLRNHAAINELITERDEKALEYLTDIRYEHIIGEKLGFKLLFEFSENPYFTEKCLEKAYYYQDELGYEGEFMFDRAVGATISWKPEQDLTKEIEIKKQRNKHTNKTRLVRKARTVPSFFNFFTPPEPPTEEQLENEEFDEEELEDLDAKLELDYQIGEDIKEKIVPRAIDYFTGKALRYEVEDEEYSGDEDDDDDDDDELDDDDDEEEEEEEEIRRRTAKRSGAGVKKLKAGGAAETAPAGECKQQ